jgi:magnesium chelatase family protein
MPSHNGVLFLDDVGEFEPLVLDNLRQPLEEGVIRVARATAK